MKRIFFYTAIIALSFISCSQDEISTERERENGRTTVSRTELLNEVFAFDREADMLRPFARALYKAMSESPMLRELIRTRALEKFNREYDVLYQFIKDEVVENGLTVRQLLLTHFESEETLAYIERNRPTLTIFVPRLPEGSFSAESWNTDEEVPFVALHVTRHIHTPIVGYFGEYGYEFLMKSGLIPAFPVVALRNNARVRVAEGRPSTRSAALDNPNSDFVFEFIFDCFDGSKVNESTSTRQATVNTLDPTLQRAFQIYPNSAAGWQRDYIYYNISPASPNGRINRAFEERITSFRFSPRANPEIILREITNSDRDPTLIPSCYIFPNLNIANTLPHPWTAGHFTFVVDIHKGARQAHLSQRRIPFSARPEQLFEVTFTKVRVPSLPMPMFRAYAFTPRVTGFRTLDLSIPLMTWDLQDFETAMRISIEKFNSPATVTETESRELEFAGNFGFDATFGSDTKFGLRFGTSARDRRTVTTQVVRSLSNINLGDVIVHFGDMVVLGQQGNTWRLREYDNNTFAIIVRPVRTQP